MSDGGKITVEMKPTGNIYQLTSNKDIYVLLGIVEKTNKLHKNMSYINFV